jgi:hypothetical protein
MALVASKAFTSGKEVPNGNPTVELSLTPEFFSIFAANLT